MGAIFKIDRKKLLDLMAKRGSLSQKELAEKAGVARASVCNIINHERYINSTTLVKLSSALGVQPSSLLLNKEIACADMEDNSVEKMDIEELNKEVDRAKDKRIRIMRYVNSNLRYFVKELTDDDKEYDLLYDKIYRLLSEYTAGCMEKAWRRLESATEHMEDEEHDDD
ncbi:helix-turn-helix domain-containing protein [Mitsuokella multacida]|uniref:helix-turn-helix domain-containing protein n=1 Tax=Mitsuokella multacida TaxID=52226 RepID=UPI002432874F|nr:helix-turn-helix transcriptional regulator [Mitsuokella multacida]